MTSLTEEQLLGLLVEEFTDPQAALLQPEMAVRAGEELLRHLTLYRRRRARMVVILFAAAIASPLLLLVMSLPRFFLNILSDMAVTIRDAVLHAASSPTYHLQTQSAVLAGLLVIVAGVLIMTGVRMANIRG